MLSELTTVPVLTFQSGVTLATSYTATFSGSGIVVLTDGGSHSTGRFSSLLFPASTATSIVVPRTFNLDPLSYGYALNTDGSFTVTTDTAKPYLLNVFCAGSVLCARGKRLN